MKRGPTKQLRGRCRGLTHLSNRASHSFTAQQVRNVITSLGPTPTLPICGILVYYGTGGARLAGQKFRADWKRRIVSASQWVANTIHGRIQLPREWKVPSELEEGVSVNWKAAVNSG